MTCPTHNITLKIFMNIELSLQKIDICTNKKLWHNFTNKFIFVLKLVYPQM